MDSAAISQHDRWQGMMIAGIQQLESTAVARWSSDPPRCKPAMYKPTLSSHSWERTITQCRSNINTNKTQAQVLNVLPELGMGKTSIKLHLLKWWDLILNSKTKAWIFIYFLVPPINLFRKVSSVRVHWLGCFPLLPNVCFHQVWWQVCRFCEPITLSTILSSGGIGKRQLQPLQIHLGY